jgi:hypothetical protein
VDLGFLLNVERFQATPLEQQSRTHSVCEHMHAQSREHMSQPQNQQTAQSLQRVCIIAADTSITMQRHGDA